MGVIKRNGNTYGGGGGASADGKAESSAIAPVFDDTETYAAGDRVMYEDELYVFNTAHTGAWDAADADKSDVDSEIPAPLTSQQMQDIKDAFNVDVQKFGFPVLFDETGAEHFVGWYKYSDGTKKPIYEKTIDFGDSELNLPPNNWTVTSISATTFDRFVEAKYVNSIGDTVFDCVNTSKGSSYIEIQNICQLAIKVRYLTLRYTKITDTPV